MTTNAANDGSKSRDWCFTINNPTRPYGPMVFLNARYAVCQVECGDRGTEHIQGYVQFAREVTFATAKRRIGQNPHLESMEGTCKEASDYCKKDEGRVCGPWEFGEYIDGQGSRTDVREYRDAIVLGKRNRELCDEFPEMVMRYSKYIDWVRRAYHVETYSFRSVYLHVGETGLGKTAWVYDNEELFWKMPIQNGTNWYDNYQGDACVLLDDFSGGFSKVGLTTLLRLLDGYHDIVPTKGNFTPWKPDKIYITTNIWPDKWYDYNSPSDRKAHFRALVRRFTVVRHFTTDGVIEYDTQRDINDLLDVPPPESLLMNVSVDHYDY